MLAKSLRVINFYPFNFYQYTLRLANPSQGEMRSAYLIKTISPITTVEIAAAIRKTYLIYMHENASLPARARPHAHSPFNY